MTKQRRPLLIIATLLFGVIVPVAAAAAPAPAPSKATGQKAGSITALLPIAHIERGAGRSRVISDAKKGDEIIWNDLIKTERGGRARITLTDQSILSLGSQADLRVIKHDARTQQTALQMTYGRVRAEVARVTRQGGSFELRTPTAVAGVIGTDFGAEAGQTGDTTFVCISGLVQVSNSDPNIAGSVQCAPGMTTTVTPGKAPTPPTNATPGQIQQLIQDTEPAIIMAMVPMSALPGATVDATLTGTKMGSIKSASIDGTGVSIALSGVTDTTANVHMVIAPTAAPGPRTIHLSKPSGADSAAVFTILAPPTAAQGGDLQKPYLDLITQEGQTTVGGLSAYLATLQQQAGLAIQQLQQANTVNLNLADATNQFNSEVANVQAAISAAAGQINQAMALASTNFTTQYQSAYQALLQRSPNGTPDDQFNQAVKTAFDAANASLAAALTTVRNNLQSLVTTANTNIAQAQQTWMTTIASASAQPCDPGQICPVVNSAERSVDVGAALGGGGLAALDASNSKASSGGSIVSYRWVLCDPSYKPAQSGVPLAANATAGCNAIAGYASSSSDFQFPTCNLQPNDYVARVTVTDSNNKSAAMDVKLHILAGAYDDPATVVRDLAQAYGNLQVTGFLNYFDQIGFSGFTQLSENVRNTFPTLASMSINPRVSQAAITCNDATVRADWVQNYTYKVNPTIAFSQDEQLSMRMTRTPGKGWLITDFQGDNGTVQGQLPGPVVTDAAVAKLSLVDVFPGATSGQTTVAPGQPQVFTAVVSNVGGASLSASTVVRFVLLDSSQNPISGTQVDVAIPVPLAAGAQVNVTGTITVPALAPNTAITIQATADPGGDNSVRTTALIVGGGDLRVTSAYLTSLGSPTTAAIPVAAGNYAFTAVVTNAGTSNFVGNTVVQFSLLSGGTAVSQANATPGIGDLTPGQTVTVTGTIAVPATVPPNTQLTFTADVNPGCTAAETSCGAENFFTQTLAVNALVTETAFPSLQAGGTGTSALTITAFSAATVTLSLPNGISAGAQALTQTLAAGASFTWNLSATLNANGTDAMSVLASAGVPATVPMQYSVSPPKFAQTAVPSLLAGGAAGAMTVTTNVPGSYTLVLPAGVTTTSANPQVITSASGGTLSWNLAADFTAATGTALTTNVVAGAYTFAASYSIAGQPNYVITSAGFAGHTAPYTGANALQVGESTSLIVVVQNVGDASPTGNITLAAICTPLNTADTTSCTGGNNPTGSVAAPAAGQSVTATLPLGSNTGMIPGHFTGTVTLATAIAQNTSDDSLTISFDTADFILTVQNQITTQYMLPGSSQNFTVAVQVLGTTPFAVPVTLSLATGSGITFAPGTATVSGTQVFSVTAAGTAPTGGVAIVGTGVNRGVSRLTTQAFVVISPTIVSTNLFVNDASNPLLIPVASTTPQSVALQISGSSYGGAATIVLPTLTGFSINTDATAGAPYNTPFNVNITATAASTAAVPMTVMAQLPNTNPVLSISKTIYVQGSGLPDLAVISAKPNATFSTSSPWIDGQGVDYTVTVQNIGTAPSAGGEKVVVELGSLHVGAALLSTTPMAAGATQTITIHAVAPDLHGNTAFGPTTVNGRVHIEPVNDVNAGGEVSYTNNSLAIAPVMANWHLAVSGAGSQSTPLQITTSTSGGSQIVFIGGTIDGGASFSSYSGLTFAPTAGQASTSFSIGGFGNSLSNCGTTPPSNTVYCATVATSSGTIQAGLYYAQALVTLTDPSTGQQTVRQATVAVQVNTGSNPAIPCLTSSANNISSQNSACGSTAPTTLQINGGLPEQFTVTMSMLCGVTGQYSACTGPGHADLAIQDAPNTTTTAGGLNDVAVGEIVPLHVAAVMDANGDVTTGPATPYVIGINGVQQPGLKRGSTSSPDAVGAKVNFAIQVGDIDVTASGGTQSNGGWCGGVVPGGSGLPVSINWNLLGGFNAAVQWAIEDANHAPVGGSPFSFSVAAGSGTGSISETITNPSGSPINTLTKYFLAATISNGTSTATKYFPFFVDGSTGQNFCGAISGARGRTTVTGTWSRSVADTLGPLTTGVALSQANQKPAAGLADVHLVASGISYTPSIPRPGDTVYVRFGARNDGTADAVGVPIALQVNGSTVAIDTFDVAAGHSTLGGLSWTVPAIGMDSVTTSTARPRRAGRISDPDAMPTRAAVGGLTQLQAALVVDPNHITRQATTLDKTAAITRLNVNNATSQTTGAGAAPGQHVLIELEDGACAGLRLSSGGMSPCGTADLEITVADLAKSQLGLDTMAGVSDVGTAFEATAGKAASYNEQAAGLAGHVYSVRLANGGTATVTIESIRNPAELDAKARALFRASAARVFVGSAAGAAAPGDLTGVDSRASMFITLNVRQN